MIGYEMKGIKTLAKALQKAGDAAPNCLGAAVYAEGLNVMAASVAVAPVGVSGALRASHFVEPPKIGPSGASVQFGYGGVAGGYALYVHEGVGPAVGQPPFFPPPEAFEDWVRLKGIDVPAFVIARSVGQKGIKPNKFLEGPLKKAASGMGGRMAATVRKCLKAKMLGRAF